MSHNLKLEVVHANDLSPLLLNAIHALCHRAYEEDVGPLFATFSDATHVLGFLDGDLVSHAMWVTRWLQRGDNPLLRTAYVEMVATEPQFQGRGYATAVMRRLAEAISAYDLGGLSPAETGMYARLGWVFWRGPLSIRWGQQFIPTPDEQVMILRLPQTPLLDLGSARHGAAGIYLSKTVRPVPGTTNVSLEGSARHGAAGIYLIKTIRPVPGTTNV